MAHEFAHAAAQHGLLAEQVGFGLFLEVGFNQHRARTADAGGVRQRLVAPVTAGVLMHGVQTRHTAADLVLLAHQCAGTLRRDQDHVDVGTRKDRLEVNVEAVRKQQRRARLDVRCDDFGVQLRLHHVRRQHSDEVGTFHRFRRFEHAQSVGLGGQRGRAAAAQADDDVETGVAQVQCMRPPLTAIAEHRDALALEGLGCRFHFCCHFTFSWKENQKILEHGLRG